MGQTQTTLVLEGQGAYLLFPNGERSVRFHAVERGLDVLMANISVGRVSINDNADLRRQIIEHFEPRWRNATR